MKLTVLGTGNAAVSECYNTCFALSKGNSHFLVDAGGGNRILKVLKDTGIDIGDIHDIFITHEHVDHVLGIIWLIRVIGQRMNQGKYDGELRLYCHEELSQKIQAIANMTIQQKVCRHMAATGSFTRRSACSARLINSSPTRNITVQSRRPASSQKP